MQGRQAGLPSTRPNIIIILADDLGFSDIGCYGAEISTPNLDQLARRGIRFTQMYNCARCCPTRASLLTGLYPHQAGVGHMGLNHGVPSYQGYLRYDRFTIAEVLKGGGYRTALVGKWHVGGAYDVRKESLWKPGADDHPLPTQRGFDYFYGTLEGCGSYFNPHTLMDGEKRIRVSPDRDSYYYTDDLSDNAVQAVEDFLARGETPFFLYLSYTAPHWPLHALPQDIMKYKGHYSRGWDECRMNRYERLIADGIINRKWPLSPRDKLASSWKDAEHKEWEDMRMAVYAAQIDRMDQGVGRVLRALKTGGIEENTLVMFLSDNGGCAEFLQENGWIENFVYPTRRGESVRPGNDPRLMPGPENTFMSYDLPWANVSNTPFRFFKRWVHEGGIATPFIVCWPRISPQKGLLKHNVLHVVDIMKTCLEAAEAEYPRSYKGQAVPEPAGESFLPLLHGSHWARQQPALFWEHEGNCAVRIGDWKLVREYGKPWELYNLEEDRSELNDRSGKEKNRVRTMEKLHEEWAERSGVLPWEHIVERRRRLN